MLKEFEKYIEVHKGEFLDHVKQRVLDYSKISGQIADSILSDTRDPVIELTHIRDSLLLSRKGKTTSLKESIRYHLAIGESYNEACNLCFAEVELSRRYLEDRFKEYLKEHYNVSTEEQFWIIYNRAKDQASPFRFSHIECMFDDLMEFLNSLKKVGF